MEQLTIDKLIEENKLLKEKINELTEHLKKYTAPQRNKKYYDLDNDEKRIECYNCFCDMKYDHYIFCNGKCYWCWCWQCSETQYINIDGSTTK